MENVQNALMTDALSVIQIKFKSASNVIQLSIFTTVTVLKIVLTAITL
jgi:hypothetical protein